jgi:hypothetical protein
VPYIYDQHIELPRSMKIARNSHIIREKKEKNYLPLQL